MKSGLGAILSTFKREKPRGSYAICWLSTKYKLRVFRRDKWTGTRWTLYKDGEGKYIAGADTLKGLVAAAVTLRLENKL